MQEYQKLNVDPSLKAIQGCEGRHLRLRRSFVLSAHGTRNCGPWETCPLRSTGREEPAAVGERQFILGSVKPAVQGGDISDLAATSQGSLKSGEREKIVGAGCQIISMWATN
jgi:hypothetical protein